MTTVSVPVEITHSRFSDRARGHARVHEIITGRVRVLYEAIGAHGDALAMNETSRADMHVHSTASQAHGRTMDTMHTSLATP